jgi:transcriptional regulator with XRE-family HTH domain
MILRALKLARTDAGLTITELSRRAGVARDTVSNVEKGGHAPNAATLHKIARALGKQPSELLAEEERLAPKAEAPPSQDTLFNGVSEQERRALDRIKVFCDQLETAASEGKLDEPMFDTIFRVRVMDLASMIPALYENESIRPALHPLAIRFLDLARQLGDDAETNNVIDFAAERLERRAS